ncbi:MAG: glutamate 5-kinase [Cyanobacteria bacterium P01_A01_bin.45]
MSQTIVVKIGTSSLTQPETGKLALSTIATLTEILCDLQSQGNKIILVSSGAVGVGCGCLGMRKRPAKIALKQAVAAVGQGRLMRIYDDLFTTFQQPIAQVLLTRSDLVQRSRYLNVYNTFQELLKLGVIPVVNENDTVAIEELKFGDNDTLSALVASLVEANWLFLLTDVDKLYSADPRFVPDAQPIEKVTDIKELVTKKIQVNNQSSGWGTGGMVTKISAARIATAAGVRVAIAQGKFPENIQKILRGESVGTQFEPHQEPTSARKRWIAYGLISVGKLYLDSGAVKAISMQGKSLLATGIISIEGKFDAQEALQVCDSEGNEIARGLVNYSSEELNKISGCRSSEIVQVLGYEGSQTVIHRDNLVLI